MKPKMGREIALLAVPILIIGGVALWQTRAPRGLASGFTVKNPFDPGPMRLEFSEFKKVPLSPVEVASGYDCAVQTTVTQHGNWDMPKDWKRRGISGANQKGTQLHFRRGKVWKSVARTLKDRSKINLLWNIDENTSKFKVNLSEIPRDADEVRLRGRFSSDLHYGGSVPKGWVAPKNLRMRNGSHILTIESEPFDIPIKAADEPFPISAVSRVPEIELVNTLWLHEASKDRFLVIVRHVSPGQDNTKNKDLQVLSCAVKDGNGKPLALYYGGAKYPVSVDAMQSNFGYSVIPRLPNDQSATELIRTGFAPRDGWDRVKQPISVDATIRTSSSAWPLTFRAKLTRQKRGIESLVR
jgi:hypothetical protein